VAVADETAAGAQPLYICAVRDVVPDPEHDHQDDAGDEREGEEVVGELARLREGGERLGPDQRQQQHPAEGDVEAGDRQHDEADAVSQCAKRSIAPNRVIVSPDRPPSIGTRPRIR
jgi:hypothetical protein